MGQVWCGQGLLGIRGTGWVRRGGEQAWHGGSQGCGQVELAEKRTEIACSIPISAIRSKCRCKAELQNDKGKQRCQSKLANVLKWTEENPGGGEETVNMSSLLPAKGCRCWWGPVQPLRADHSLGGAQHQEMGQKTAAWAAFLTSFYTTEFNYDLYNYFITRTSIMWCNYQFYYYRLDRILSAVIRSGLSYSWSRLQSYTCRKFWAL